MMRVTSCSTGHGLRETTRVNRHCERKELFHPSKFLKDNKVAQLPESTDISEPLDAMIRRHDSVLHFRPKSFPPDIA